MTSYAFIHNGQAFTPDGKASLDTAGVEAHNAAIEARELEAWATKPDAFVAYVTNDRRVTTWRGVLIGRVSALSSYRNNMGARIVCLTVRGNNGATYHGRYGADSGDMIRLRRARS